MYGVVVGVAPSIEHIDPIYIESLNLAPLSSPSQHPSHLHAFDESLEDIKGYKPSFDAY